LTEEDYASAIADMQKRIESEKTKLEANDSGK